MAQALLLRLREYQRGDGRSRPGQPGISRSDVFKFYAYSAQAAAVRMFLRFFGLGVLAFEVGERHSSES
jgi:hypothetical protein